MKLKYIKNTIAIISFISFLIVGVKMYFEHINTNVKVDSEMEEIKENFLYDYDNVVKNEIGLTNPKNSVYILNASNTEYKEKILELIKKYNDGTIGNFYLDNRETFETILKNSHTKFFGDSNVEHFSFYDALDKSLYDFMTGKSVKKQKDIIVEKLDKDVKNVVIFNGYNLEEFKTGEDYVNAYIDLINVIKEYNNDIKIYICSLLPAEDSFIIEDYKLPLPHNIYKGKEFDKSLENAYLENAMYIDTKWIGRNDYHTTDGVHMIKDFYYVLIPYISYFVNLYN